MTNNFEWQKSLRRCNIIKSIKFFSFILLFVLAFGISSLLVSMDFAKTINPQFAAIVMILSQNSSNKAFDLIEVFFENAEYFTINDLDKMHKAFKDTNAVDKILMARITKYLSNNQKSNAEKLLKSIKINEKLAVREFLKICKKCEKWDILEKYINLKTDNLLTSNGTGVWLIWKYCRNSLKNTPLDNTLGRKLDKLIRRYTKAKIKEIKKAKSLEMMELCYGLAVRLNLSGWNKKLTAKLLEKAANSLNSIEKSLNNNEKRFIEGISSNMFECGLIEEGLQFSKKNDIDLSCDYQARTLMIAYINMKKFDDLKKAISAIKPDRIKPCSWGLVEELVKHGHLNVAKEMLNPPANPNWFYALVLTQYAEGLFKAGQISEACRVVNQSLNALYKSFNVKFAFQTHPEVLLKLNGLYLKYKQKWTSEQIDLIEKIMSIKASKGRELVSEYFKTEFVNDNIEGFLVKEKQEENTKLKSKFVNAPQSTTPINMVIVESGSFQMGDTKFYGPVHKIFVDTFFIGTTEVTQEQWKSIMGDNPSFNKGDNLPVEQVSWYDCIEFCNKLSAMEGLENCYTIDKSKRDSTSFSRYDTLKWTVKCNFNVIGYRLPTEAEWEYACTGGKNGKNTFHSGDDDDEKVAWGFFNSNDQSKPVGQLKPNEIGIYDMSGNVNEWCWDWFGKIFYTDSPEKNPIGPQNGDRRIYRGENYGDRYVESSCKKRNFTAANYKKNNIGFRVVRSTK